MRKIYLLLAVAFLSVMAFCFHKAYSEYSQEQEQIQIFDNLAELVEETEKEEIYLQENRKMLPDYINLYHKNNDLAGWISIEGTQINYPVMQTPDNPDYYLNHNFEKEYSRLGVPYLQENCIPDKSDNLIIYGHHIKGGVMFGALESYKSEDFYKKHKFIRFDTLMEHAVYEVTAVFRTNAYGSFRYNAFVEAEQESDFSAYINKCRLLSFYDTGTSAVYGDTLLTLSTCEYSADNSRLVIVAKKYKK